MSTATLGGYSSLKNVPSNCEDYSRYLWAAKVLKGIPVLLVYETTATGRDKNKDPINLGEIMEVQIVPHAEKLNVQAKKIKNLAQAKKASMGLHIYVHGKDKKDRWKKNIYVMIGNIYDGELDEYYFPEDRRTNEYLLDTDYVVATLSEMIDGVGRHNERSSPVTKRGGTVPSPVPHTPDVDENDSDNVSPSQENPQKSSRTETMIDSSSEEEDSQSKRRSRPSRNIISPSFVYGTPKDSSEPSTPPIAPRLSTIAKRLSFNNSEEESASPEVVSSEHSGSEAEDDQATRKHRSKPKESVKPPPISKSKPKRKGKGKARQSSPPDDNLFDTEALNAVKIDDIKDPTMISAIVRSNKKGNAAKADRMNLETDAPIARMVDKDLVTSSSKFDEMEEVQYAQKSNKKIIATNEVGQFPIPITYLIIPSLNATYRPLSRTHAKSLAYSMKVNPFYNHQPALVTIDLPSDSKLYKMLEQVRKEKVMTQKYGMMDQVLSQMHESNPQPKFTVYGSTHSLTAYIANAKSENPDISDDEIEYPVKIYLNLSSDEKRKLAASHNVSAGITLKESSIDILKNSRSYIESNLQPKKDTGEYLITKEEKLYLRSIYKKGFLEHIVKGLCLNKENYQLLYRYVDAYHPNSFAFLENFNVSLNQTIKKEMLTKLANGEISEQKFKQYFKTRSRRSLMVSLVIDDKWCKDRNVVTAADVQKTLPDLYKKIMDGSFDAVFSKFNFRKKDSEVLPNEFRLEFIRQTTAIDRPNLSEVFASQDNDASEPVTETANKVKELFARNAWSNTKLFKVKDSYHLIIQGTLNDADPLRHAGVVPDIMYISYPNDLAMESSKSYNDLERLPFQFPGNVLSETAFVIFSEDEHVLEKCKLLLLNNLKIDTAVRSQWYIRRQGSFSDLFGTFLLSFPKKRKVNGTHKRNLFIFDDAPLEILKEKDQNIDMYQKPLSMDSFLIKFLSRKDSLIISVNSVVGTAACTAAMTERNSITFTSAENFDRVVDRLNQIKILVESADYDESSIEQPIHMLNEKELQTHIDLSIKKRYLSEIKKREREQPVESSTAKKPRSEESNTVAENQSSVSTQSNSMNVDKELEDIQNAIEEGESCENSVQETQDVE